MRGAEADAIGRQETRAACERRSHPRRQRRHGKSRRHMLWPHGRAHVRRLRTRPQGERVPAGGTEAPRRARDGKNLEVQIRTHEMHRHGGTASPRARADGGRRQARSRARGPPLRQPRCRWRGRDRRGLNRRAAPRASCERRAAVVTPRGDIVAAPRRRSTRRGPRRPPTTCTPTSAPLPRAPSASASCALTRALRRATGSRAEGAHAAPSAAGARFAQSVQSAARAGVRRRGNAAATSSHRRRPGGVQPRARRPGREARSRNG